MQIIDELENAPRGFYCGAIGFISHNGEAALNVAIRTAQVSALRDDGSRVLHYHAGCGIVAQSEVASEIAESHAKTRALMQLSRDDLALTPRGDRRISVREERAGRRRTGDGLVDQPLGFLDGLVFRELALLLFIEPHLLICGFLCRAGRNQGRGGHGTFLDRGSARRPLARTARGGALLVVAARSAAAVFLAIIALALAL